MALALRQIRADRLSPELMPHVRKITQELGIGDCVVLVHGQTGRT
jgi:hypothetical protein